MSNDKVQFHSSEPNGRNHFFKDVRANAQSTEPMSGSEAIYRFMKSVETLDREAVYVLHLDARLRIIGKELVSLGNLTGSIVDPKSVLREAIIRNCAAVVMVHNHPSGCHEPSEADRQITIQIKKACELMRVDFLDHLIIGCNGYFSFADKRIL
jgi:DNA repair protein RadC